MSTYVSFLPSNSLILPSQAGNAGKYLTTDGTSLSWGTPVSQTINSGVLDKSPSEDAVYQALALKVTGAASATDGSIALFDGITGKMIRQGLGWTIDSGALCAQTDGMYNIGKAADNRPGYVYVKTAINLDSLTASTFVGSNASKNLVSLSSATATSYLNQFTNLLQGVVPASGGGTANFLRADGTWAAPVGGVTNVTASAPLASSGGATPNISITKATSLVDGYLAAADFVTFSGKMSNPMTTAGDIIVGGVAGAPARLALGTVDKVLVSGNTGTVEYQYAGLGGGAFGTNNIFLGRGKPSGLTSGTSNILISNTGGAGITSGTQNIIITDTAANAANFSANTIIGAGISSSFSGAESVLVGATITATTGNSVAIIGKSASSGANSNCVVAGASASVTGSDSVSVGYTASAGGYGTAIGRSATAGNDSVALGQTADASGANIAIGSAAKARGTYSVVIGYASGKTGAIGTNNTVIGSSSFNNASLTLSANATIVGQGAGTGITTASGPTIIGQGAGTSVTTQAGVTVVGYIANATGQYTTVIGRGATGKTQSTSMGYGADGGDYCTVVGYEAGGTSSTACNALGSESQRLCTGSSNQSLGNQSLYNLTSGSENVAIGEVAGYQLTTQSGNVMLGHRAGRWGVASNEFYVGNQNFASNIAEKAGSLMYGQFNAAASSQTLTVNGAFTVSSGEVTINTDGKGLSIKSGGTAARVGKVQLPGGGGTNTVVVNTTAVTANSIILLTAQTPDGGLNNPVYIAARTAGTSFTIETKDSSYSGFVGWMIVEPV